MSSPPKKSYTPSVFSITSNSSSKPLMPSNNDKSTSNQDGSSSSKSQRLLQKTKNLLSSIGEVPTADYDRKQEALGKKAKVDRYGNSIDEGNFEKPVRKK